ncbi:NfeD family protein [Sphingosinicella sp.]|uniref:NfeD family protein n=1 Tax=Sphingosinicella sp. TaxID=1917971 RepID=UPI0040384B5E
MDQLAGIDAHWWWLASAALLAIFEIFAPGVFLIWMAAAAAVTGITVALMPIPLAAQLGLFALLAIAAVAGGRRHYANNPVGSDDPLLNDRAARLIGETVTVVTAIVGGEGRVKVGDGVWSARGADAPEGARVVVTGAQGNCLKVRLAPQQPQLPESEPE